MNNQNLISVWFALLRDQWLPSSYLRKCGGLLLWLGLSVAYAGLTLRLRSAYAGGAGSLWQTTSKSRRHPNPWCLTCHVLLSIPLYFYSNYDKIRLRKLLTQWYIIHGYAKVLTRLTQPWEFSGIALTRSFSSSPFFIFLSFQKKRCSNVVLNFLSEKEDFTTQVQIQELQHHLSQGLTTGIAIVPGTAITREEIHAGLGVNAGRALVSPRSLRFFGVGRLV